MKRPLIGEIWEPVTPCRWGDILILDINYDDDYGCGCKVKCLENGIVEDRFAVIGGMVAYQIKAPFDLENE